MPIENVILVAFGVGSGIGMRKNITMKKIMIDALKSALIDEWRQGQ